MNTPSKYFLIQFKEMEHKIANKPMKKEKASLVPPKRGQIKAKMYEELVEKVMNITTGFHEAKSTDDDEDSGHDRSSSFSALAATGPYTTFVAKTHHVF
ncbi:unnamed protein product [Camellia sinensis]